MTMADRWREEGMEQGLEKGLAKGLEMGRTSALAETAILQLTEKFGKLPQHIQDDILSANSMQLGLLLSNIFRYESIEDVRKYI